MDGEQEDVVGVAEFEQGGAHEQILSEVEGTLGFFFGEAFGFEELLIGGEVGQIEAGKGEWLWRCDELDGLIVVGDEVCTQDFVASEDLVESVFEGGQVEVTFEADGAGHVVGIVAGVELFQKPQPLL